MNFKITQTDQTLRLWQTLTELVHYNPDSGIISWKKTNPSTRLGKRNGEDASFLYTSPTQQTYRKIVIGKTHYIVHRVAVFLMTGRMPIHPVVHLDGDSCNNRWDNLEECDPYREGEDIGDFLRSAVRYDPDLGTFTRTRSVSGKGVRGRQADSAGEGGVRVICVTTGRRWYAHTAAWYLMTGELPKGFLRHKNGNRSDNRWVNLEEVAEVKGEEEGKEEGWLPKYTQKPDAKRKTQVEQKVDTLVSSVSPLFSIPFRPQ